MNVKEKIRNGDYQNNIKYCSGQLKEYENEEYRLYEKFREDLKIEANEIRVLTPKQFSTLFYKAWEIGHSSGYEKVYDEFFELLTLSISFDEADEE